MICYNVDYFYVIKVITDKLYYIYFCRSVKSKNENFIFNRNLNTEKEKLDFLIKIFIAVAFFGLKCYLYK